MNGRTILFLSLLFCLFPFVVFAEGKGHGVEARLTSPKIIETIPGKIVTAGFLVSNLIDREETFFEELKLPAHWQPLIPLDIPFSLKPKEQQVRIVPFSAPPNFPAGIYEIIYSVRSQRDYAITDRDTFSVVVLPVVKLESNVEERPAVVIAGKTYRAGIRFSNRGNVKTGIKLEIKGTPDYPIKVEPPGEMALEAGSSQVLTIEVRTDEKLNQKTNHILKIRAVAEEVKEGIVSTEQTLSIEIIPRVTGTFDPYHRIPLRIKFIGAFEDTRERRKKGGQVEFSGSGSLDEEGKRKIDFLFRGPDIQEKSIWGERDEYRFSFYNRPLDFHLGDRAYSLSPLTESFRYGRGAEVDFHPGRFGMGAFFLNTRWTEPEEREIGTYLRYQFGEEIEIKGNFLNKSISEKDFTDNIASIEGKLRRGRGVDLELEGAFAQSSRQKKVNDYAYRVDLWGGVSNDLWYSFEKTYAGPGFFGYYRGVDYTIGTINFPIYGKLRGNLNLRRLKEDFDPELDDEMTTANKELSLRGGLSYFFPFGTNISLNYEDFQREDRLWPRDYDFREKLFRLGLGQAFRKFSLQTYIDRGRLEDRLSATKSGDVESYSIYGMLQPGDWQSYSLYTRFGHSLYTESLERTTTVGISGNWRIKDRLNINVNYQKNIIDPDREQEQDNILASLAYALPNHHSIALKGRWTKTKDGNTRETSLYLSYTIPFGIPVGKKKSIGMIKGRVYDGERPEKPFIPNVILTANGATAVTNRNGRFIFPALKPGNYYLQVEKGSIGLGRTTMERLPAIAVKGGETNEIEIPVVTSCKVSGRVILFAPKNEITQKERFEPEDLKQVDGLANVLIEISKGNEAIRQLTDEKGRFSFEDLRPGRWALKAYEDNLPPYHYLEKGEFLVDLRPGQEEEITINVFPRPRRIKIIEEGEIN